MMKKIIFLSIICLVDFLGFAQTDKYTEKLQQLYINEEYYKVIEYKSKKEAEMASVSLYFKGLSYFMVDQPRKAIRYFDDAIEKGNPLADMYFFKGVCHLMLEEYEEAVEALTEAVDMEPEEWAYHSLLGKAWFYQDKFEPALQCFEKAADLEKDDAELYAHIGDCNFELKHYDAASTAYEKSYSVAEKFKQKKYAHFRLAESQYLAGDFSGAKETLTKHTTEFKNDYNGFSLMIQVHYALQETEEVKALEVKMNDGKEKDQIFPAELRKMYCIDQFKIQSNDVKAYQAYKDQSYQSYPWRHKFMVRDADGKELFTVETQLDSSAGNENAYTICKAQGDSLLKFENVIYDENFNYLTLREIIKKIISGESQPIEIVTGYNAWLKLKKANLGGDGTSIETAIMIESIPAEYAYVRENYPGSSVMMQSLLFIDGIPYDVLRIKTEDGEELDIYFNISSFFGKW